MDEDNKRTIILEGKPKKPMNKGLKVFLIILAVFVGLAVVFTLGFGGSEEDYSMDEPYIGVVYVEGPIQSGNADSFGRSAGYQHYWTLQQIDNLMEDFNNRGMVLFVNSPGGGMYESDELYLKIKEYQEITGNPVYAYMGATAASGGYYIATPADKIVANRNTWTGSIGVTVGTMYDISDFLSRYGVKTETITSGRNKAMGSVVDPMTAEEKEIWQSLVDEAYNQFTEIVAAERNISLERVKEIGDGRIYSAKQALSLSLVDDIGTFEETVEDMKQSFQLEDCSVIDMLYRTPSLWDSIMHGSFLNQAKEGQQASNFEAAAVLSLIERDMALPISYTCQWLTK